jgi:hypothetical protein
MNISVHKCKHTGKVQFSIFNFQLSNKNTNSNDGCPLCDDALLKSKLIKDGRINSGIKEVEKKSDDSKLKNQTKSCCSSANKSEKKLIASHSCCLKTNKTDSKYERMDLNRKNFTCDTKHDLKKISDKSNNQINSVPGKDYQNSSCCRNSNLHYALYSFYYSNDNTKIYTEFSNLIPALLYKIYYNTDLIKLSDKGKDYPLKRLILNIISFIHFTSVQGDDSDAPVLRYS